VQRQDRGYHRTLLVVKIYKSDFLQKQPELYSDDYELAMNTIRGSMDTSTLIEQIQAQGERITLPRRLVIEALGEDHRHLTISAIQQQIQAHYPGHSLSETTIYRVLQWLKGMGLISQTDMGEAGIVYALTGSPYHHHLICLTCGAVITAADMLFDALREGLLQEYGFNARIEHMAIYGQCRNCLNPHGA
jgi:Fur family ferric uptake transcriptional regulator